VAGKPSVPSVLNHDAAGVRSPPTAEIQRPCSVCLSSYPADCRLIRGVSRRPPGPLKSNTADHGRLSLVRTGQRARRSQVYWSILCSYILIKKLSVWREIGDIVGWNTCWIVRENDGWPRTSTGLGKSCERRRNERRLPLTPWVDGRRRAEKHGADGGARMSQPEVSMPPRAADVLHSGAEWSDRDVRREAARYALAAMTAREPVTDWIIDDTGFPKQGTHSVGVQRQYSGTIARSPIARWRPA